MSIAPRQIMLQRCCGGCLRRYGDCLALFRVLLRQIKACPERLRKIPQYVCFLPVHSDPARLNLLHVQHFIFLFTMRSIDKQIAKPNTVFTSVVLPLSSEVGRLRESAAGTLSKFPICVG